MNKEFLQFGGVAIGGIILTLMFYLALAAGILWLIKSFFF